MTLRVAARHRFGDFQLDVAFEGPADGVTALFGPSGAGKSATLAIVAGTVHPDAGFVAQGEHVLTDTAVGRFVAPERRRIGVVHQDARLFPHMSVARNLRYGWRRATGERRIGFDAVVAVLAIAPLLARRPHDLSGGERQRVAIGRALLSQPDLLLLDEPVSALDAARRADVLAFIAELKAAFALPMLYVSHRADEVHRLADHVVRIDAGRVAAMGAPEDVLPQRTVTGQVVANDAGQVVVRPDAATPLTPGQSVTLTW